MSRLRAKALSFLVFATAAAALAAFWPASQPGVRAPGDLSAVLHPPADVGAILDRSCRDCHSVNTRYPWYAALPLASGLIRNDVRRARMRFDLSTWDAAAQKDPEGAAAMFANICEQAREGAMPPLQYRLLHRAARIRPQDASVLCAWSESQAKSLAASAK